MGRPQQITTMKVLSGTCSFYFFLVLNHMLGFLGESRNLKIMIRSFSGVGVIPEWRTSVPSGLPLNVNFTATVKTFSICVIVSLRYECDLSTGRLGNCLRTNHQMMMGFNSFTPGWLIVWQSKLKASRRLTGWVRQLHETQTDLSRVKGITRMT